MYTVKQLSRLAGISPRTLHYYDQIGLLAPAEVAPNGYRHYDDASMMRLQQILLYRELGLPLEQIKRIIHQAGYDNVMALKAHKKALQKRIARLETLVETVENTIQYIEGGKPMSKKQLFAALTPEQQEQMDHEALQTYNPQVVKDSQRRWKQYGKQEQDRILEEGNQIYGLIASLIDKGAGSDEVQRQIARWHDHIKYFWNPNWEQLLGLAELYNEDPRFRHNFDQFDPRLAPFMREAVAWYVKTRKNQS